MKELEGERLDGRGWANREAEEDLLFYSLRTLTQVNTTSSSVRSRGGEDTSPTSSPSTEVFVFFFFFIYSRLQTSVTISQYSQSIFPAVWGRDDIANSLCPANNLYYSYLHTELRASHQLYTFFFHKKNNAPVFTTGLCAFVQLLQYYIWCNLMFTELCKTCGHIFLLGRCWSITREKRFTF